MAKKTPSPAVVKSVQSVVTPVIVETVVPTRGPKKFTSDEYLTEYRAEVASGGTWDSLCLRTGFTLSNCRQCVTIERSSIRQIMAEKVNSADVKFQALIVAKYGSLAEYIEFKTAEQLPFIAESGTRNTSASKRRQAVRDIELTL